MSKQRGDVFSKKLRQIFQWYARAFVIPFGFTTYYSLKLLWVGYFENKPQIYPYAIMMALSGFILMSIFLFLGFTGPDPIQELHDELTQLRREFEECKRQCAHSGTSI